jgi:ubiquinone/menaquinone biosynthesis C-methylase UbiE
LYRRFSRVISIDVQPTSTRQIKGDLEVLPFRDGCFDIIVCLDVMEHVKDDRAAMREIWRVLTPGGVALIHVPLFDALRPWYAGVPIRTPEELWKSRYHGTSKIYREYNRDGMLKRLGEAGLTVHLINYPDDEFDIGPSNPKGPLTLFACWGG